MVAMIDCRKNGVAQIENRTHRDGLCMIKERCPPPVAERSKVSGVAVGCDCLRPVVASQGSDG